MSEYYVMLTVDVTRSTGKFPSREFLDAIEVAIYRRNGIFGTYGGSSNKELWATFMNT